MVFYNSRKKSTRTYRRRKPYSAYKKSRSGYFNKSLPSRLRGKSKKSYTLSKAISKEMNRVAESRFVGVHKECIEPVKKFAGSQKLTYICLNSGEQLPDALNPIVLPGTDRLFSPMSMFTFPQSSPVLPGERVGRYLYLKHATLKFNVQMIPQVSEELSILNSPTLFRFICIKARSNNTRYGTEAPTTQTIFLQPNNQSFGLDDTTRFEQEYNQQPINKRHWMTYCDKKFILSPPADVYTNDTDDITNVAYSKYPTQKTISLKLPCEKKVLYGANTHPVNFDSQWLIFVQACPLSYCNAKAVAPKNWVMNYVGTTSANDS